MFSLLGNIEKLDFFIDDKVEMVYWKVFSNTKISFCMPTKTLQYVYSNITGPLNFFVTAQTIEWK